MRIRYIYLLLSLVTASISCGVQAAKIDTIYFQSGDRITAEVKALVNNQLKLSTDNAGTIFVEWNNIDSVHILNNQRIMLDDGQILYGKLLPGGEAGKCYIWGPEGDPLLMELVHIVALAPLEKKFVDRLNGSLSSGFSYVKSTEVMQMNFNASIAYESEKNQVGLSYNGLFSTDPSSGYSQNQNGAATGIRILPRNWFVISVLSVESNSEMDLDLRTSINMGGGNAFIRNDISYLYTAVGFQGNRETSLGEIQFNLEGVITAKYSLFIYDDPEVTLTLEADLIPSLNEPGRIRSDINTSMNWEIFNDFYLKWTFYFSSDNKPISDTAAKNDWSVTLLGLEYKL